MLINDPFLTINTWAMQESKYRALADQAKINKPTRADDDGDDDMDSPGDVDPCPFSIVNGVAIISLSGPLLKYECFYTRYGMATSTLTTKNNIQSAVLNPEVGAILIVCDSPGGMVSGTGDVAETIKNSDKPVWVYISDCCASAAYWIASQADKVYCNSTAQVGSIGVYCVLYDTSKMYEDVGISAKLIKAGKYKGVGVAGVEITDDQVADEQREVDDIYSMFIDVVATGRNMSTAQATKLATGQMWIADKAKQLGLVDGIGSIDDVFTQLSGEVMASKKNTISPFSATKAGNKTAEQPVGTEPVAVEPVTTPTVTPEPVAVAAEPTVGEPVTAPTVAAPAITEPVATAVAAEDAKAVAFAAGVASERARFADIKALATDHPTFVMEQFNAGADKSTAAVAYSKLLASELASLRTAHAKGQTEPVSGAKPVALGSVESRDGKADGISSLFRLKK